MDNSQKKNSGYLISLDQHNYTYSLGRIIDEPFVNETPFGYRLPYLKENIIHTIDYSESSKIFNWKNPGHVINHQMKKNTIFKDLKNSSLLLPGQDEDLFSEYKHGRFNTSI